MEWLTRNPLVATRVWNIIIIFQRKCDGGAPSPGRSLLSYTPYLLKRFKLLFPLPLNAGPS